MYDVYYLLLRRWTDGNGVTSTQLRYHNFRTYRSLQVMNALWLDLSKPIVVLMLFSLAVMLIAWLFLLVRGGNTDYSLEVNAAVFAATIISAVSLFIGGLIFFYFSLTLTSNSNQVWVRFLRYAKSSSKHDIAFCKSCRHISMYIGNFFPAKNKALPLIYFGEIVIKTTIDLLLTFR